MAFYKEKIQKQLKKALQNFKSTQNRSYKTRQIQKEGKIKRVFKPRNAYRQQTRVEQQIQDAPILNFFNLITVNSQSVKNPQCNLSYLQNNFYSKTIKKIEVKEHYIVLSLKQSGLSLYSIAQTLDQFKNDSNTQLQKIGLMLEALSKKINIEQENQQSDISLTNQTFELLDSLGAIPYICKIFSQKIVISKTLLQLQEYNSQQFLIQCLKYKLPLFQYISCQNYSKIIQKQIQYYNLLFDMLNGEIPDYYFFENTYSTFIDTIKSKNNVLISQFILNIDVKCLYQCLFLWLS